MANAKSIYLETTSVAAGKTVAEMMELLQRAPGVIEVAQRMSGGLCGEIRFKVEVSANTFTFQLKPDIEGVRRQFKAFHSGRFLPIEQAERIAWRQLSEWLKIEVALIESGARDTFQAFLSTLLLTETDDEGNFVREITAAKQFVEKRVLALAAPEHAHE